jgi:hypothetical protein
MKVSKLMDLLSTLDPDEPIVFQFLLAEHTDYSVSRFAELVDILEDSDSFGDHTSRVLKEWLVEAEWSGEDGVGI